jgi:hypothetical protein
VKQLFLGILVVFAGIGAIIFNRFTVEETFRAIPPFLRPWNSVMFARIFVVVWGLIVVLLGLVVIADALAWHHPCGLTTLEAAG